MEKITMTEFYQANGLKRARVASACTLAVINLKLNEGLKIGIEEWPLKTHPSVTLAKSMNRRGRQIQTKTLEDGSGWLIVRTK